MYMVNIYVHGKQIIVEFELQPDLKLSTIILLAAYGWTKLGIRVVLLTNRIN